MSEISDATAAIEAAAATVEGLRVHPLGASLSPPAVVVGPPRLDPLSGCPGPGTAVFPVNVVVARDDRALETVWELTVAAWVAIEAGTAGVITGATPGTYTAPGTTELPSYELTCEYPI